ncbi:MAG TPA: PaaI family thioesterase [Woeseiaceae bacterium]|nr:PaaI family thioesterase [Woeseiaceae bacterium]
MTAGLDEVAAGYCRKILSGGMARTLGFEITALTPKRITAQMKLLPRHMNHNGRVNGGAIMAFADLLGALGAAMHRPAGYRGGTLESKTNFFSAGTGAEIRAVCVPLHVGRTTSVWQTTVKDSEGRTIAMVTQTQMALPGRAP